MQWGRTETSGKPCTASHGDRPGILLPQSRRQSSLRTPVSSHPGDRQPLPFQHRPRGWMTTRWLKECG